jgi:hypothetical protein
LGQKAISGHLNKVLKSLLDEGVVAYTIPEKPRSRAQKYRLVKSPQEKEQPGKKL